LFTLHGEGPSQGGRDGESPKHSENRWFFVSGFVCDIAYWITGNVVWPMAAIWLIGAGIIMAALAGLAGLADVLGEQRIRVLNDAWWHAGGIVIVVLIELYNWYARYSEGTAEGLVISFIVVCILAFAGRKGLKMVYRHRVGVTDEIDARKASTTTAQ
jgi:uncharacterized membrane protein